MLAPRGKHTWFYCRMLAKGEIAAGGTIIRVWREPHVGRVSDLVRLYCGHMRMPTHRVHCSRESFAGAAFDVRQCDVLTCVVTIAMLGLHLRRLNQPG